ncbi:uncharacterized protein LOC143291132 [Babylonia areolata]|uniref:uncharacterized protein LOC143291132 n=1 Tax=Babylonia areolata TaxID=304850 RepID=UPI003FD31C95
MAAGGATKGKMLCLPVSGINLTIMEGNIIETSAQVVGTGEDPHLEGRGAVSQLLLKSCPPAYKKARDQLKKTTQKLEFGKVYPCSFPQPHPSGRKKGVSFSVVLHAIVPSTRVMTNQQEWLKSMKVLYYHLFKAANNQGRSSLALPLLGSGQAGASIEVAAEVLAQALTTFKVNNDPKPHHHHHHHHLKDIILYVRKEAFQPMVSKLEEKLRAMPNGVVQHAACKSGSAATQGRPPSSSSTSSRDRKRGSAPRSGKAAQTFSGPTRSSPRGAAPAPAGGPPASAPGDMSNVDLILKGLTLESFPVKASQPEDEEDMDCEEFEFVNHDDEHLGEGDGESEDADENDDEEEEEEEETCSICLDVMTDPKKLDKCGHSFCRECIEASFRHHKPVCPSCNTLYGMITGNQPRGTMTARRCSQSLPGFENCGQIIIDYEFPSGIQGSEHPNPGQSYRGTGRRAYLPDSAEGRKVYRLLRVAFESRLVFTVGRSVTTGADNVVTWNDIHHKTSPHGGATNFGYPDPYYLSRVQEELAAKGITEECLRGRTFDL